MNIRAIREFLSALGLVVLACAISPGRAHGQDSAFRIDATRLANDDLAFMLLWGEQVYVPPAPADAELRVRFWRAPIERSCGPMGHMICAYHYYLAVTELGEGSEPAVYDLGEFGSILTVRWASGGSAEQPALRMTALNYPVAVFPRWPGLKRQQRTVRLQLSADTMVAVPER